MPQLWTETYVSQYFWLIIILGTFNYFFVNKIVPAIARNIKARKKTGVITLEEKNIEGKTINVSIPSIMLTPATSQISFASAREEWVIKKKKVSRKKKK